MTRAGGFQTIRVFLPALLIALSLAAFIPAQAAETPARVPAGAPRSLNIGVTAALGDSGLMDFLAQAYRRETGVRVHWLAEPSINLMYASKECDLDAFISDTPELEFSFMQGKYGEQWLTALYCDFMLVGPMGNPAKVPTRGLVEALRFISSNNVAFASARDGTGNREAENYIWNVLKLPEVTLEPWYITAPTQPHTLLPLAGERKAYAFVDAWSWNKYLNSFRGNEQAPLEVLVPKATFVIKQYNIIIVSRERCPGTNTSGVRRFADWLISSTGQAAINSFRYQGRQIFHPLNTPE